MKKRFMLFAACVIAMQLNAKKDLKKGDFLDLVRHECADGTTRAIAVGDENYWSGVEKRLDEAHGNNKKLLDSNVSLRQQIKDLQNSEDCISQSELDAARKENVIFGLGGAIFGAVVTFLCSYK